MNKTYRLIWSIAREAWVVVAEKVTAKGGIPARTVAAVIVLSALAAGTAYALPQGGQVAAGSSTISQSGSVMQISQATDKSIINWQSYGIAAGETVRYSQPSATSVSLNRVIGVDPSVIHGQLSANGRVWVINPNGLMIGSGARIEVGGFLGSTLNITDHDFMNNSYRFNADRSTPGSIGNLGDITAAGGGYVMLIAPSITNAGIISAPLGKAYLASGNEVTLNFAGNDLIGFTVDRGVVGQDSVIGNNGVISANGGEVILSAKSADKLLKNVVNNTGVIEARTVENRAGRILLLGDMDSGTVNVGGTLDASAPSPAPAGHPLPGGEGDNNSPLPLGEGVGVRANGGFIETSAAHVKVADGATITTKSASGKSGTWLIDPVDFTIAAGSGALTTSGIGATTLSTSLGSGNVSIATDASTGGNGDIFVNSPVSWSANTLTLSAHRNIEINAQMNGSGTAGLALEYGQGAVAAGNTASYTVKAPVNLASTGSFSTKLGSDGTVKNYTILTSLGAAGSTTGTDLQGIRGNPSGNYVLGADIDASSTSGWNGGAGFLQLNTFTGCFDGLGHIVSGLTINRSSDAGVGMFGITNGATLRNVGLTGVNVTGNTEVGGLVGSMTGGSVSNSYVTGTVTGTSVSGSTDHMGHDGGLVGLMIGGSVTNSYASVAVNGTAAVGGLVGQMSGGSVSASYATGAVSGSDGMGRIGGLVGNNNGTVSGSYATGAVSGLFAVGGFVGYNQGSGNLSNSYWDTGTSGTATGVGSDSGTTTNLTGLATANAYTQANYANLDFTNTWWMADGSTRPFLRSEYSTTITNAHQLQMMGMDLSASYTLAKDIDASATATSGGMWTSAGFVPVGTAATAFTGSLDGLGHTISGLTISRSTNTAAGNYTGLIGVSEATIHHVGLVGGSVIGSDSVGSLVGYNRPAGRVTDSYATGTTQGQYRVGGLVGTNDGGTVTNSYATGQVLAAGTVSDMHIGGLVGYNDNLGTITASYATGQVQGGAFGDYVGGLVGSNGGTLSNSFATGAVSGHNEVGGLAGGSGGAGVTVTNSYTTGSVTGNHNVGGLVGRNDASVSNSYATGAVTGGCDIATCSFALLVSQNMGTVTNSFWRSDTPNGATYAATIGIDWGTGTSSGVAGKTGTQLKQLATFAGWDIDDAGATGKAWRIYDGHTYPLLRSFLTSVTLTPAFNGYGSYGDIAAYTASPAGIDASNILGSGTLTLQSTGTAGQATASLGLYSTQSGYDISTPGITLTGTGSSANNLRIGSGLTWTSGTLKLKSDQDIAISANLNGSGTAKLALEYGQGAVAAGNTGDYTLSNGAKVNLPAGSNFSTKLGSDGATTNWTVITSLGAAGSVTGTDLQGMYGTAAANTANLAGSYVLGADIDATATSGWNGGAGFAPVGYSNFMDPNNSPFTGKFDGLGHTISNLTINRSGGDFGLFGKTNNAVLQNVGLLNVSVSGGSNGSTGALVGNASGNTQIRNSYVDGGSVYSSTFIVGGLVGVSLGGSISYSYADVGVSAGLTGGSTSALAGGLVGFNNGGAISYSYATGSVSAPSGNGMAKEIGGLVGRQASGSISTSYATGLVSGNNTLGGLVGNLTGGTITSSYWDKTTTGQSNAYSGGSTTGGLVTSEWATLGPLGSTPSNGAWNAADWMTGNTYPGIKALPYITITASASQTYGSAASFGIASILDQSGANAAGRVNTAGLTWSTDTTTATAAGTTGNVLGAGATGTGYQILYAGNLTVAKAPLTVTANDANKTYDGAAWSGGNGVSYSGFVNGEGAGVLGGTLTYGGSSQGAKNAGTYTITPGGLTSGNYTISFANGTLTINPAPLTLLGVGADNKSKTYGSVDPTLTWHVASGSLAPGDSLTGSLVRDPGENVGSYAIRQGSLTAGSNYSLTFTDGTLTINPAPLTVTATNAVKTYDGQAFSGGNGVTYSGFVNNETASVLGGTLTYGGSSQGAKNAGTYGITPGGLTSNNYALTYADGTLTVNKAPLTVTAANASKTYDGQAYSGGNGVTYSGFVNNETTSVLGGSLTYGGSSQGAKNAGTYGITPGGLTSNNYALTYADGTLTVNKAPLTVTARSVAKLYDGLAFSGGNGVTYSGFVNNETASALGGTITYGGSSQGAVNAGSYAIVPSGLASNNYNIGYVSGTLTVQGTPGGGKGVLNPASGKISPDWSDARTLLLILLGVQSPTAQQFGAADVASNPPSGDGKLDFADLITLMRRIDGIVTWQ